MKIKLSKAWGEHAIDTVLELDDETVAKELIDKGIAVEHDPVADGVKTAATKADKDAERKQLAADVIDALKNDPDYKIAQVDIIDKSDADPFGGYGPEGHSLDMEAAQKRPDLITRGFGNMMKDGMNAKSSGILPERLMKQQERSKNMREKAAGSGMIVGDDEHGGYMIFSAASQMINLASLEAAVIRPRALTLTMDTQVLKLPYLKDENHTSTVFGGIQAFFQDELAALTASRPELAMIEMKLKKMTVLAHVSGEWEKWSPVTLGSWLIPRYSEAIAWKEDQVFINGKGGAQPLGMLQSNGLITITKETDQEDDTVVLENTTKMMARLRGLGQTNIIWIANQMVMTQLPKFNVTVGTGGAAVFTTDATEALAQRLWGAPIVYSEFAAALGDAKDISIANVHDYIVADDSSGPEITQSIHFKFENDQNSVRLIKYIDGQNAQQVEFQPHTAGSTTPDTVSSVVTLGARG